MSVVKRMALTGEAITADDAFRHGLLAELTAPGEALAAATALAHTIAGNAPLGVQAVKELLRGGAGRPRTSCGPGRTGWSRSSSVPRTPQEGARAFAEKRAPEWHGR